MTTLTAATPSTRSSTPPRTGRLLGYARVSRHDQDTTPQLDQLQAAGCDLVWTEAISGAAADRPELAQLLETAAAGDTVVVWRLDRLGRSLRHLLELVDRLAGRGIGLRSLSESIDTTTSGGRLILHTFAALAEFSVISTRRSGDVPKVGAPA